VERCRCDGLSYEGVFKLLILTGERKDQVAGLQWSEIDFDEAEWRLTPERIRCGRRTASRWTRWPSIFCASYPLDHGRLRL
jgi:integrase